MSTAVLVCGKMIGAHPAASVQRLRAVGVQELSSEGAGRVARSPRIFALVLFLASDLANVITGAVHPVDCARTAH